MKQPRNVAGSRSTETRSAKVVAAITQGLDRLFGSLVPQPQARPVPVRVRTGMRGRRAS